MDLAYRVPLIMNENYSGKTAFILPAAGSGSRMGNVLKPFIMLNGKPVVVYALEKISKLKNISAVVLILPATNYDSIIKEYGDLLKKNGVTDFVKGGNSRQQSVANGIDAAMASRPDLIAVHDAVRPFISLELCNKLVLSAADKGGALPVLPVTDTIKKVVGGEVKETVRRAELFAVQTPQVFSASLLADAYKRADSLGEEITDDASVIEKNGGRVMAVEGERFNIKLTTPEDIDIAKMLIKENIV
jgi:2-C-methyl-D-erythritol 4-phosphate cytidylyltransferase